MPLYRLPQHRQGDKSWNGDHGEGRLIFVAQAPRETECTASNSTSPTFAEAARLVSGTPDAELMAGGMWLIPVMKLQLAKPSAVVDISLIPDLQGIKREGNAIVIGAMSRHVNIESSDLVKHALPALARLVGEIGDQAIRNRGTIGGSIAANDPAADYPAAVLALNATIITNTREIQADDFFRGMFDHTSSGARSSPP